LKDEDPSEPPSLVFLQVSQVLKSDKSYTEMNERIKTIKTNYYTCYECLGQRPLHLTTAFLSFFYRTKKVIEPKKANAEILINTSQEISLRYTNKLNRSSYSSLGVSRSMMLAEEEGAGRLSNPMGFP
jgi:16S rRNA A1518/A1519 N6-dimethyltransferase RsmA/KsgA/DIM1 with predicted DNA glycosylase/AP lyase activity